MSTIDIHELDDALKPLAEKSKNLKPVMRTIAGILNFAVEENFKTEGARNTKWQQLAKSTIKERTRLHLWPGKILNRHGASGLIGSITQKYGNDFAQVGTNKIYARILQMGGTINIAARSEIYERMRFTKGNKKGKFKRMGEKARNARVIKQAMTFKAH